MKEARDSGSKMDFESLVALLKDHPWEESQELLENKEEHNDFNYTIHSGEYEETVIEE